MSACGQIATFASQLDFARLPKAVQDRAAWIVVDTVGAIAGGSAEPELRKLAATRPAAGGAALIGLGTAADAPTAAFINGTAGTFLELDEGNRFSRGHPAVHVVPAVLAAADEGTGAGDMLSAIVAGYEVASRIGAASRLRSSMHPHGTWGTIGAAVAAGRLAGLAPDAMEVLINIASSLTLATSKRTMLEGGLVRNVYAGIANRHGLLALDLLHAGFTGEQDGIGSVFGAVASDGFDPDAMVAGLGTDWSLMQNYFKLHACCRYNHGALDAIDLLDAWGELPAAADIAAIHVRTYNLAAELDAREPDNTLAAKFSVPFALATRIVGGASGWRSFAWAAVRDEAVRALARKVEVVEAPEMTARLPFERPAAVTVERTDGSRVEAQVEVNRGDETAPYTGDQLADKFLDLTGRIWPESHGRALLGALRALPGTTTPYSEWAGLLRRAPDT